MGVGEEVLVRISWKIKIKIFVLSRIFKEIYF